MSTLSSQRYTVPPSGDYPLHVVAKRYSLSEADTQRAQNGFTLILMHATGCCKEIWEVTILRLLERQKEAGGDQIHDVFSIESPNHGESAELNELALKTHYPTDCECMFKDSRFVY